MLIVSILIVVGGAILTWFLAGLHRPWRPIRRRAFGFWGRPWGMPHRRVPAPVIVRSMPRRRPRRW